jgi:mannose-1-phosphate guanylyltransferase
MENDKKRAAIIMAGGIGTRFWPLSRKKKPKQFLPIISEKTMIEETVNRLLPLMNQADIYTIANSDQTRSIREFLPALPEENCLVEPQGKNTAPSLMLATAKSYLKNPNTVIAALPADHLIQDLSLFHKKLEAGMQIAAEGKYLIIFGMPPTYPSTGYGYIHISKDIPEQKNEELFYEVQGFKEKPAYEQAKRFIDDGRYLWNSGMFIWQAGVFAHKLKRYAPSMFSYWERMLRALQVDDRGEIESIFEEIPAISIDYALIEKAEGVLVCPGNFGWSDVGSWSSLGDIWSQDEQGNTIKGNNIVLDSRNCLCFAPKKLTVLIGVENIIVVDTDDAILICNKAADQKVKDIVVTLRNEGKTEYL